MTTTKTLLTMAVIAVLPFGAKGYYTYNYTDTPTRVANDGAMTLAKFTGPYVTVTPTVADESHIATTAYVKGAYNDAIAAINRVKEDMDILDNEYGSEIAGLYDSIENQRVVIYTTWGDDSDLAAIQLPLSTAQ